MSRYTSLGDGGARSVVTSDAMRYERQRQRRCSRSFFNLVHSLAVLHSQLLH
jgi:hypothetical protein